MADFKIFTDSACDIPEETLAEWGVAYSSLTYTFEGDPREYGNYELPYREFYDRVRKGGVARTSAVNAETFLHGFEQILLEEKDILYVGFSSGLSSTCSDAGIVPVIRVRLGVSPMERAEDIIGTGRLK